MNLHKNVVRGGGQSCNIKALINMLCILHMIVISNLKNIKVGLLIKSPCLSLLKLTLKGRAPHVYALAQGLTSPLASASSRLASLASFNSVSSSFRFGKALASLGFAAPLAALASAPATLAAHAPRFAARALAFELVSSSRACGLEVLDKVKGGELCHQ